MVGDHDSFALACLAGLPTPGLRGRLIGRTPIHFFIDLFSECERAHAGCCLTRPTSGKPDMAITF